MEDLLQKYLMMMKQLFCLILGCLFFVPFMAQASMPQGFANRYDIYKLSEDSELFHTIEDLTEEIILRDGFHMFCEFMWDATTTYMVTGLSENRAISLYKSCGAYRENNSFNGTMPKIFRHTYIVANDPKGASPVQSWTSDMNETVIFIDPTFTREKLRHVLAHELAISVDAKTNMMYSSYLMYENMPNGLQGRVVIRGSVGDNEVLRERFNVATYRPIAFTFGAMRALSAEQINMGQTTPVAISNHAVCSDTFLKIFETFVKNTELTDASIDSFSNMMARVSMDRIERIGLANALKDVLAADKDLEVDGRKVSFCQYMATPLFSPRSVYSLFAAGPRPKVTGGWSLERPDSTRNPRDSQNIYDSIKRDVDLKRAVKVDKMKVMP